MKRILASILISIVFAAQAQNKPTFPEENQMFYLVGIVQIEKGQRTFIKIDKPAVSPCDNDSGSLIKQIYLWNPQKGGQKALSQFIGKRIVVNGYIACPNSGTVFIPNEEQSVEVY